jgi:predicted ATPase
MLREFAEALEILTIETPLVLILEDLQWSDYATLDLLSWLARRREPARLLLLGTYRPVEVIMRGHPLQAIKQDLELHRQSQELPLELLTEADVAQYMAAHWGGSATLTEVARVVYQRTDGYPLFMAMVVEEILQQGRGEEGQWQPMAERAASVAGIPSSLRQLVVQQLEQLSEDARQVLEAASVVGSTFSTAIVAAGLETTVEAVEAQCERLVQQGRFLHADGVEAWPDGTVAACYRFRHAFHQHVVYDGLPAGRCMRLHQRIGLREEAAYGLQANARATELARHFRQGHDDYRAVQYSQYAAENALQRYAYQEAVGHLTSGLEVLRRWPDTLERTRYELDFRAALGEALMVIKGFATPEVADVYTRAWALCQQVEEPVQRFSVLWGLQLHYTVRGEVQQAQELGQQLLHLAQGTQAPALLVQAQSALGNTLYYRGEFVTALAHLEQGAALASAPSSQVPRRGPAGYDPQVACLRYAALTLWMLGYPEQALRRIQATCALAQEARHPPSQVAALVIAARLSHHRREAPMTYAHAEAAIALAQAQGFAQRQAAGAILRGWARAAQGQVAEGIVELCQGLNAFRATGASDDLPYWLALLAESQARAGQTAEGLGVVEEALAEARTHGLRVWEAELYRLKGDLLAWTADTGHRVAEAKASYLQALNLARQQQARSLELRATMSLSRLLQQQGKRVEARALLAPIYAWFTEGFDIADLQEARALLEELER